MSIERSFHDLHKIIIMIRNFKVWLEKKYTHISVYHTNLDCLGEKSFKSTKSTHTKDSKLVRQVHIVQRLPPGSIIKPKNYFWEITNFVKK